MFHIMPVYLWAWVRACGSEGRGEAERARRGAQETGSQTCMHVRVRVRACVCGERRLRRRGEEENFSHQSGDGTAMLIVVIHGHAAVTFTGAVMFWWAMPVPISTRTMPPSAT